MNCLAQCIEIDQAIAIHRHTTHRSPLSFPALCGLDHRRMLRGGDDQMLALLPEHLRGVDGGIVRFRAAAGEDDLVRLRADHCSHLLACLVQCPIHATCHTIGRRRIRELLAQKRQHRIDDQGVDGRGGVVVEVGHAGSAQLVAGRPVVHGQRHAPNCSFTSMP